MTFPIREMSPQDMSIGHNSYDLSYRLNVSGKFDKFIRYFYVKMTDLPTYDIYILRTRNNFFFLIIFTTILFQQSLNKKRFLIVHMLRLREQTLLVHSLLIIN